MNSIYKLTDLRSPPEKKRSLIFRTFDVKFDASALTSMYSKKEATTNGNDQEKVNGVNGEKTNGINGEQTNGVNGDSKEKIVNGKSDKTEKPPAYGLFNRETGRQFF